MLGGLGPTELLVILVIILVVFGAGKLPDIASGLGKGLKDFKKAMSEPEGPDTSASPEDTPNETRSSDKKREDG